MSLSWMSYALFVGAALAAAALAGEHVLRRASLPSRWVWVAGLAGIVALAVLAPRRDEANVRLPAVQNTTLVATSHAVAPSMSIVATLNNMQRRLTSALSEGFIAAERRVPHSVARVIAGTWGALTITLLLLLLAVAHHMDDERRMWPRARVGGMQVRVAPETGPAVVGLSSPEIVVPRWLLEKSSDEQRLVIMHESEHLAARDQLLMVGGWLVVALLPWHPAVWWMMSRLRLAIELDCDARVLRHGVQPRSYGTLLIDIAGQCAGRRMGALALADRTSHLERRLHAMKPTTARFATVRIASFAAVAALAVLAACEAKLPTAAEVQSMDVAAAQKAASPLILADAKGGAPAYEYFVDGKPITQTEALTIEPSKILSLQITKAKNADGGAKATMEIATKGSSANAAIRVEGHPLGAGVMAKTRTGSTPGGKDAPLFVIDGKISASGIGHLTPEDIQSVEVLKGAAAAAAYDAPAAANGVIVITTKHAASDRP
jgi:TonB-dependent SusC/RagA subfamily outer membrane receptor